MQPPLLSGFPPGGTASMAPQSQPPTTGHLLPPLILGTPTAPPALSPLHSRVQPWPHSKSINGLALGPLRSEPRLNLICPEPQTFQL